MKELTKQNRYIHANDILSVLGGKLQPKDLERTLHLLSDDGVIHSAYANDIYSITTE